MGIEPVTGTRVTAFSFSTIYPDCQQGGAVAIRRVTAALRAQPVDNSRPLWMDLGDRSFFHAQGVCGVFPGQWVDWAVSDRVCTANSPGCAQCYRRVFTDCPQGCAHHELASLHRD